MTVTRERIIALVALVVAAWALLLSSSMEHRLKMVTERCNQLEGRELKLSTNTETVQ